MVQDESAGDAELPAELGTLMARAEPPPAWVVEAAKASFDLRSIETELAMLVWDSAIDEEALAVRGAPADLDAPRALSFEAPDLSIELEVSRSERGVVHLMGQLAPAASAQVEVVSADGLAILAEADELGRFAVDPLRPGLVRVVVRRPGGPPVGTDWFRAD